MIGLRDDLEDDDDLDDKDLDDKDLDDKDLDDDDLGDMEARFAGQAGRRALLRGGMITLSRPVLSRQSMFRSGQAGHAVRLPLMEAAAASPALARFMIKEGSRSFDSIAHFT
jgi:hypothetical protein